MLSNQRPVSCMANLASHTAVSFALVQSISVKAQPHSNHATKPRMPCRKFDHHFKKIQDADNQRPEI